MVLQQLLGWGMQHMFTHVQGSCSSCQGSNVQGMLMRVQGSCSSLQR